METFFVPLRETAPHTILVDGEEGRHLTQSLRMRTGERCRVVDGRGNAYDVVVTTVGKGTAECSVEAHHIRLNEPAHAVTLAAAILKNPSRFEYLIEKAVELGVTTIVPLLTERTIARGAKSGRWEKIAIAAMKQCGRSVLPAITEPATFAAFLETAPATALRLIPHEKSSTGMPEARGEQDIVVVIGPEGGFSDGEIERSELAGFHPVSLGVRRLRAETAAVAALAMIQR
jgi:16S rRNA (uracil1498-N3)-methyltransferase